MIGERYSLDKKAKELTDLQTGEIYTTTKEVEEWYNLRSDENKMDRDLEKDIIHTFGIKTKLELYQLKWKSDSWFIKIYRTEMRDYKKNVKLTSSTGLVLFYLQDYIEHKTNRVVSNNGKNFTNKDICDLVGLSEKTIIKALTELEEKQFIKRVGNKRARQIYFNPFLASAGNEIEKSTIKLFEDYTPIYF